MRLTSRSWHERGRRRQDSVSRGRPSLPIECYVELRRPERVATPRRRALAPGTGRWRGKRVARLERYDLGKSMTPISFRLMSALCSGLAAGLVLAACNPGAQTPRLASDQTLNFPILNDFSTL